MKVMVCLKQVPHQDARLDVNSDGTVDVVGSSFRVPGALCVWYGSGGGEWFSGKAPADEGSYWGVAGGDFNFTTAIHAVVVGGRDNIAGGTSSVVLGAKGFTTRSEIDLIPSDRWVR